MIKEDPRSLRLPVIKVVQPIGEFYVGTLRADDLVAIADFDVRKIQQGEGIESYLGIQREISKTRVAEIREYVKGPDATFPTAVVLAVSERSVILAPACDGTDQHFWMTLSNVWSDDADERILYRQIARVIDGQHRIEGLRNLKDVDFQVNVAVFVGADIPDQAAIFSTVNLAQTKVNKSLVYDLFELAKSKSPEKLAHGAVVALNRVEESPFYHRIKRLGTATEGRATETLTQATVVGPLLGYISGNSIQILKDRQQGRRGGEFERLDDLIPTRLILRPFLLKYSDAELADLVWNYFDAVREKWPLAWNSEVDQGMLNRTNGYNGLMRFFRDAYLSVSKPGEITTKEEFDAVLQPVQLVDADLNSRRYVPGTSGAADFYKDLKTQSGL
jgi:DGQHR domain-containing protein